MVVWNETRLRQNDFKKCSYLGGGTGAALRPHLRGAVMRYTNKNGLPQLVFESIAEKELVDDCDIRVTELIDSPRIRMLKKLHYDQIEIEADSELASFLGTCFHKGIEAGTKTGTSERRLFIQVNGWKLSGGMDHYHDGVLTDIKTCNVWKTTNAINGEIEEWENQLNVYAHILRENGFEVKKLMLFALFKDWNGWGFSEHKKKGEMFVPWKQAGYPERNWLHFEIPLWEPEKAERYVSERVSLHQAAETLLPNCTTKEVWKGANRCKKYCSVSKFCEQRKQMKKTGLVASPAAPEPKPEAINIEAKANAYTPKPGGSYERSKKQREKLVGKPKPTLVVVNENKWDFPVKKTRSK